MKINVRQRRVLQIAAIVTMAMLVFPPTMYHIRGGGFRFLFALDEYRIDAVQLVVQWLGVLLFAGIAFVLAKDEG